MDRLIEDRLNNSDAELHDDDDDDDYEVNI
jgi:hypothetical protein